jgi:hypothetical protein
MSWVTRFYPKAWRARYGREFDALLEDVRPGWRGLTDVLWGAMKIRLEAMDWRRVTAFGLAGLAVAAVVAIRTPDRYTSAAVLEMRSRPDSDAEALMDEAWRLRGEVVSRTSLSTLIQEPLLNLYHSERARMPIEDVIRDLKARDLKVEVLPDRQRGGALILPISYAGPDAWRAQRMVQALITRLMQSHMLRARRRALNSILEAVNPASLPDKPVRPNWWVMESTGLALGLLACIAVFGITGAVRRFPRAALSGVAGAILAGLVSLAIPRTYESSALLHMDSTRTRDAIIHHQTPVSGVRFEPGPAPQELVIRVRAFDRFEAQKFTQNLLSRQVAATPWPEVVDPASLPTDPISYGLPTPWWMIFGGLLFGTIAALLLKLDIPRQPPLTEQIPASDV